jgi:hypothetical protein
MVVGRSPWEMRSDRQIIHQMKGGRFEIPLVHGPLFVRLIHSMVTLDSKRRVSASEALDDPFNGDA